MQVTSAEKSKASYPGHSWYNSCAIISQPKKRDMAKKKKKKKQQFPIVEPISCFYSY